MFKKHRDHVDFIVRLVLHLGLLFLALSVIKPIKVKTPEPLIQSLWSTKDRAYLPPGSQFKIFKPYLPAKGRVSLILDQPNNATTKNKETSYDAQNYLAPVIINLETVEPLTLVYCSTQDIAEQRLKETGYRWTQQLSPGKGFARKTL